MLKRERIHRTGSLTLAEARSDVFDYVERGKSNHRPEMSTRPGEVQMRVPGVYKSLGDSDLCGLTSL